MRLGLGDLRELRDCAVVAARAASVVLAGYAGRSVSVERKQGGGSEASQVVTEVDRALQAAILTELEWSRSRYDLGMLAEESEDDGGRFEKDFFWCVDPLDGTLPFTEGRSGYALSIALVSRAGEALVGVVFDPVGEVLYDAVKGGGVRRNGEVWELAVGTDGLPQVVLVGDRSLRGHALYAAVEAELESFARERGRSGLRKVLHGGAVMNAIWALESGLGCYVKFPKKTKGGGSLWDYAATTCLCEEAGGIVGDLFGGRLELNRCESTFLNHRGVLFSGNVEMAERIRALYTRLKGL